MNQIACIANLAFFGMNVWLYYRSFAFARQINQRIATVVRRVRQEMEHNVVEFPENADESVTAESR